MKRLFAALLLAVLTPGFPKGALGQGTKAQFANQDGSLSPGVVMECPDPAAAGKTIACAGVAQAVIPPSIPGAASPAAETAHVFCTGACRLYALGFPACPGGDWAMLFDAASAPPDGAVSPAWYAQSSGSGLFATWINPRPMTTGAVAVCSATGPFTKTAIATEFTGQAQ